MTQPPTPKVVQVCKTAREEARRLAYQMGVLTRDQVDEIIYRYEASKPPLTDERMAELREGIALETHKWGCGHLPKSEQEAIWERDKWQLRSKATTALDYLREQGVL